MKVRGTGRKAEKIEPQMAPMIDVVFQLLIFFMLTLRITSPEGDFNINMPIGQSSSSAPPPVNIPPINVHLVANSDGTLGDVILNNNKRFGTGEQAFQRLNSEILQVIGRPGDPLKKDIEVEIEADYNLHYRYAIKAVSACTGRMQKTADGEYKLIRYIEKIKFAPPKPPS